MLGMNSYPKEYIDYCRANMEAQLAAYRAVAHSGADRSALATFEPLFFNNLTLLLDNYFVHRLRTLEGKEGNVLNELRMICTSLLLNGGIMCTDKAGSKALKYDQQKSVAKIAVGEHIKLDEAAFESLFAAYFAEIEARFSQN